MKKKIIVISAINFFEGGPLRILFDVLEELGQTKYAIFQIIFFVHKKAIFEKYISKKHFTFIELPKSRKNYFYRLFYEYIYFYFYSLKQKIFLWISLHDITPNVNAKKRVVYCHNPTPFYKMTLIEKFKFPKLYLSTIFYKYFYQINLKKNNYIIVQQSWLKDSFVNLFKIETERFIIAHPNSNKLKFIKKPYYKKSTSNINFIYPCISRPFKNIELIAEAAKILSKKYDFNLYLTIDGSENYYSSEIYKSYKNIEQIKFLGHQSFDSIMKLYLNSDVLLFPSKIETWGLPITEFIDLNKKILVSKLPYAYETVGSYRNAIFLDSNNTHAWVREMENIIISDNTLQFETTSYKFNTDLIIKNWKSLFNILLK